MNIKNLLNTVLALAFAGIVTSALGQNTVIEMTRYGAGSGSSQSNNPDFNFSPGFASGSTGDHTTAPGVVSGFSTGSRYVGLPLAAGVPTSTNFTISPNGGHAVTTGTTNFAGTSALQIGTTYLVSVAYAGTPTASSPDITVSITDTGMSGVDTINGVAASTCFQAGNGYNKWVPVGYITPGSASPTINFAYNSGVSGRWNIDGIMFSPFAATPPSGTLQYWNTGTPGGTGSWTTSIANWNTQANGSGTQGTYTQADIADFNGTAGTVTIDPVNGITTSGGLEFDVNGYIITGGPLTLVSSGTNIAVTSGTATINSVISGSSGLCNAYVGTLNLGAVNNFTGTVTISYGTLNLVNGYDQSFSSLTSASTAALGLGNNTLTVGSDNTSTTNSGVISDGGSGSPGSIVKNGTGLLALSALNTYHGTTTINSGTIQIGADNGLGTAPASVNAAQLTLNGGRLDFTAAATLAATRGITLDAGGGMISTPGTGTTPAIDGPISGSGSLTIPSGGIDLKGNNSGFSGNFYVTATPVDSGGNDLCSIRFDAAGSSGTGKIFMSPTTAVNCTLRNFNTTGNIIVPNALELDLWTPTQVNTQIYLAGGASSTNVFAITFSGNINGAASVNIGLDTAGGSSNPGGTVNLSGSNTLWTGGATLQAGTLGVGSSNALGTGGLFLVPQGPPGVLLATTPLTGPNALTNSIGINTALSTLTFGGNNSLQLTGPVFLYGSSTLNITNTASTIISGSISDFGSNFSLTITGSNTSVLTLTGASSYTGGTTISSGILDISTGSIQGNVTLNGGILELDNNTALATTNTINFVAAVTGELDLTYPANTPLYIATLESVGNPQPNGTYGAVGSSATYTFPQLAGTGIVVVGATPTTTTITGPASVTYGSSSTYTATVTGGTPVGTVQFYVDGVATGGAVNLSSGTAQQTITAQGQTPPAFDVCSGSPAGTHQISAVFTPTYNPSSPLANGAPSTSANYPVTVTPLDSITVSGSRAYDGATDANASVLTVSGGTLFSDSVTVASGSGSVASAGVSATPQSITPGTLALGGALGCNYTILSGLLTITNSYPKITNTTSVVGSGPSAALQVCWQTIPGVIYHVYTNANLMNGQTSLAPSWVEDTATTPPSPITGDGNIDCVTLPCASPLTNNFVLIKQTAY